MHNYPSFADGKTFGGQAEGSTKQGGSAVQAEPGSLPALSAPWPASGCPWPGELHRFGGESRVSARPIWRELGWLGPQEHLAQRCVSSCHSYHGVLGRLRIPLPALRPASCPQVS